MGKRSQPSKPDSRAWTPSAIQSRWATPGGASKGALTAVTVMLAVGLAVFAAVILLPVLS